MKYLKNPFIIVAFGLTFMFFMPMASKYLAMKIIVGVIVISYGISLGAFKRYNQKLTDESMRLNDRLEEVQKKLLEMEIKEKLK